MISAISIPKSLSETPFQKEKKHKNIAFLAVQWQAGLGIELLVVDAITAHQPRSNAFLFGAPATKISWQQYQATTIPVGKLEKIEAHWILGSWMKICLMKISRLRKNWWKLGGALARRIAHTLVRHWRSPHSTRALSHRMNIHRGGGHIFVVPKKRSSLYKLIGGQFREWLVGMKVIRHEKIHQFPSFQQRREYSHGMSPLILSPLSHDIPKYGTSFLLVPWGSPVFAGTL